MFSTKIISKILTSTTCVPTPNLQILRWKRKPRWMPVAKSKIFRVPERPVIPEDERAELMRLYNNYRNYMKSIRRYVVAKHQASLAITTDEKDIQKVFEDDFQRCNEINDKWNAAVGLERQIYFEKVLEDSVNTAKQALAKAEEKKQLQLELAENIIAEQKEAAKTFITADNIDQAIEHALANPVDYNFAIDLDGNKHYNTKIAK